MAEMTAALYQGNRKLQVTEIPRPQPGPGDAIIRVRAEGVCGSDLLVWWDNDKPETKPAGHEVAGEIVEVGEGVDSSRIGERVAVDTLGFGVGCGSCWYCRMGQPIQCQDKAEDEGGGYAQYMKRQAAGCFPVPDSLSWEEAALAEPLAVSVHAIRRGRMSGGETVLVLGAGNIGLTAVVAARGMGAGKIFVTARHKHQAEMAIALGADVALPPDDPELWKALDDATDGRGADMSVESVGGHTSATIEDAIEHTRKQGRIVILGGFWAPITIDWMKPLLKEHSVVFSSCYSVLDGRDDYEVAIDLMASGRAPVKQMVTHKYALEEIQQAIDTAYDKTTGSIKVQILS